MTMVNTRLLALDLSIVMDSPDILQVIAKDQNYVDASILDCSEKPI